MKMISRTFIFLLLLAAASGCGSSSRSDTVAAYDSAGVQIRANGAGVQAREWRVDPEPALSIGAVEGAPESMLHDVRGAVRLADGGVVLANSGSGELRWYDAKGRHLRTAGRDGGGPGEFLSLAGLAAGSGGRVHAWDATSLRLTTFGPDGRMEGHWTVPPDSFGPNVQLAGVLGDSGVVLLDGSSTAFAVSAEARRESLRIWRASRDGAVRLVMKVPGQERITWGSAQRAVRTPAPFARSTLAAVGVGRMWIGDNERYEVGVYAGDGRLARLVRRAGASRAVSDADREEFRRGWRERSASSPIPDEAEARALAAIPFPATHPAFSALQVDEAGRLWVREREGESGSRWAVYDAEGRLTASITLPPRLEPLHISANHVTGRWTDEDGVEFVRVHRFGP